MRCPDEPTGRTPPSTGNRARSAACSPTRQTFPRTCRPGQSTSTSSSLLEPLLETNPSVLGWRGHPVLPCRRPEKPRPDKGDDYLRDRCYLHRTGIEVRSARHGAEAKSHLNRHRCVRERASSRLADFKRLRLRYDHTAVTLLPLLLLAVTRIDVRRLCQAAELWDQVRGAPGPDRSRSARSSLGPRWACWRR